jgi:hypothetical protein
MDGLGLISKLKFERCQVIDSVIGEDREGIDVNDVP